MSKLSKELKELIGDGSNEFIAAICILFVEDNQFLFMKWLNKNKSRLNALVSGKDK